MIDISKAREWWTKPEHDGLTGMEALALVLEENERLRAEQTENLAQRGLRQDADADVERLRAENAELRARLDTEMPHPTSLRAAWDKVNADKATLEWFERREPKVVDLYNEARDLVCSGDAGQHAQLDAYSNALLAYERANPKLGAGT